ncbi:MAG: PilZ domain-containing protein [Dehalococcoidia bacterium]
MRGERRRYFRLEVSIAPASIRRIDARGHVLGAIDARIAQISGGGAQLSVRTGRLLPGHRLALEFVLADEAFALAGHVVRTDEGTESGAVIGVAFDELDANARRRLVASMNEHRRRHEPQSPRAAHRLR